MSFKLVKQSRFVSFDGAVSITTEHQRPDRYRHIEFGPADAPRVARGGGYSYSAASFGDQILVQEMTRFDRFLEFDAGNLTLKVEPGVRLVDLLSWAIERQLYFPVIPGFPLITVGGCIAADVHGKNPYRDGTFSDWVKQLTLYHPGKGYQVLSRDSNPGAFALTSGGFGLTGIITDATLQLMPLPGSHVSVRRFPVRDIREAIQVISRSEDDFSYSWHDATPTARFGTGFVFGGRWEQSGHVDKQFARRHVTPETRGTLPFSLWNAATARAANFFFGALNNRGPEESRESILKAAFPLASNPYYHKLFGKPGLREAQLLIPDAGVGTFLDSLEDLVRKTCPPTMMISVKRFKGSQKSLSQTGQGYLIAIDCFSNHKTKPFFDELDTLMLAAGGQPNLTKDSRVSKDVAERGIRHYRTFSEQLTGYDPERLFRSELSERIGL